MKIALGVKRIELQFFVVNFCLAIIFSAIVGILGNTIPFERLKPLMFIVVCGSYGLCAWAITIRRVFDITHVWLTLLQRSIILIMTTAGIASATKLLSHILPDIESLLVAAILFVALALYADPRLRHWLGLSGDKQLVTLRAPVIDLDRAAPSPDRLIHCLEAHMSHVCEAISATLLFEHGRVFGGGKIQLAKDWSAYSALCELGWATPEGLERRRRSAGADDLREFLAEHSLGLMTTVPRGSTTPTLIVALGTKTSGWPFTYPEIQRIQNVAELMDSVVARSRLAMQAAQNAKIEHLAMMSRGLAHDLKNLITPISTFLLHSNDRQFPVDSDEAQVHAAARRSVDIMTEYVREALFFSERLAPKREAFDVGHVLREVRAVTEARAASREIRLVTESEFSAPVVSDAVLLQRTLVNLVANAIDASPRGGTVRLAACCSTAGGLLLQVSDHGCGISADHLGHIFDPYFTTKDHGDDVRGFGLGLTICQKIVHVLEGTISVESVVNRGTTVNVELPPASIACA
jgi:signal transduction histidine kinase